MSDHSSESLSVDPDLSGRSLGDYQIIRRLGRGAMAEVYLAEQRSLRRSVAFKVLKQRLASDASYVKRFTREAQAAASLVHANIVQIHEVGCIDGVHFIAQEYVPGKNLKQVLLRTGPLEVALGVNVMRQVLAALHKAAQQRITHRDIKPENIMLATGGEVKVTDFGLARVANENVDLTQVGVTMGTPLYMSPEQVEGREVDPRSDLYSLGVTCYHMFAGAPPFDGDSPLSIAVKHLKEEPPRIETLRQDLPPGLCRIIHQMLAKDPADRYQAPAEVLRALRAVPIDGIEDVWPTDGDDWSSPELVALVGSRAEATQRLETVMRNAPRRGSSGFRGPAVWAASVMGALLVGCGIAWALNRPTPLLENGPDGAAISAQPDAATQLFLAKLATKNREAWLRSVEEHWAGEDPQSLYYVRWSHKLLAELYLSEDRLDEANELYVGLSEVEEDEFQFRAIGLVGQAVVAWRRDELQRARQLLSRVAPDLRRVSVSIRENLEKMLPKELRDSAQDLLGTPGTQVPGSGSAGPGSSS